jgi:hypothetical protein
MNGLWPASEIEQERIARRSIQRSWNKESWMQVHVQADEIRVKERSMIAWMDLAMMISTRFWVAGVVSQTRDRKLTDQLLTQVRVCSQSVGRR